MKTEDLIIALSSIMLMGVCMSAHAQGGSVKVKLEDRKNGSPVGYANVSLNLPIVTDRDSTDISETQTDTLIVYKPYKYILSDTQGMAEIKDVEEGAYVLRVEMVGYKTIEQSVEVGTAMADLGVLKMSEDVEVLNAARVTGMGNPVIVKKDTLEYSTASYKIAEHDMLEDLLRKLPGVEVASDGSIRVNGERVTRVTINGKPFFLDNPKLASKNLPANLFDKVNVIEKQTDQAIFTGIDDGIRLTVLDLTVKPGAMDNVSGTITGAGGHDVPAGKNDSFGNGHFRYRGSAMVKRFTESSQLSLILNGNNMNNGTKADWTGGLNGSFSLLNGAMDLSSPYSYEGSTRHTESTSRKTTFLDDGSNLIYDNDGTRRTNTNKHSFGVKLEHKFSKNTSIVFEPKFTFGNGSTNNYSNYTTYTDPGTGEPKSWTNSGFTDNRGWNSNWSARGSLLLRQRLGKPGRTISVSFVYSFSEYSSGGYKQSLTETLAEESEDDGNGDETHDESVLNQRYNTSTKSHYIYTRVVFTERLVPHLFIEVNSSYNWRYRASVKNTYESPSDVLTTDDDGNRHLLYEHDGETWNEPYSYSVVTRNNTFNLGTNLRYSKDSLRAQLGVVFRPYYTEEETDGEIYHSSFYKWYPQAMVSYDFNENSNIRITYSGNFSQISPSRLAPVTNNSNPLNVSYGNPHLKPYFTHRLTGKFAHTNKETFTTVQVRWNASIVQDGLTSATWYDSNGAQYTVPLNGPVSGNTDLRILLTSPFARSNFSVSSTTYFRYSNGLSYIGKTDGDEGDVLVNRYYDPKTGIWDYRQFQKDFFGTSPTEDFHEYFNDLRRQTLNFSERLRFKYICDLVEVYLGGNTVMTKYWYSISSYKNTEHWSNYVDVSMNWDIPGCEGMHIWGTGRFHWYSGYSTRQPDRFILNLGISKRLVKSRLTLAVRGYDILNQSARTSVIDGSNYHRVSRSNTFSRYVVLFLTYSFGDGEKR